MVVPEQTLWILSIVLFFGLVVPQLFRKIQLPFTSAIILVGALMGPNGLGYIKPDHTLETFGFLGAAFHMLLAGFEAETLHIRSLDKKFWLLSFINAFIPFMAGTFILKASGYNWSSSLFMGIVFISSSILMVFSMVKNAKIENTKLGKTAKSLVVVQDVVSSILIFLVFKYVSPHERFPLPILLGLIISSVVILRMLLPEIIHFFFNRFQKVKERNEAQARLVIAVLFIILLLYSSLDVHPIIGAFLVGFVLSEMPQSEKVQEKLKTIGYALFIPIYLFIIGINMNPLEIFESGHKTGLLITLVASIISTKFMSGFVGAKLMGFQTKESIALGISSSSKLTVTVTTALIALTIGLIDNIIYSALILSTIITTFLSPALMSWIMPKPVSND